MGRFAVMIGRIPISNVAPVVDCGRWPAKAAVGEDVTISATVFREGHDAVAANAVLVSPGGREQPFNRMRALGGGTDDWQTHALVDAEGEWTFRIEAWSDPIATWRHDAEIKVPLAQDVDLVCEEGARLHERAAKTAPKAARQAITKAVSALRHKDRSPVDRIAPALDTDLVAVVDAHPVRDLVTASESFPIRVERERARFSAWYEFFPRSEGAQQKPDGSWVSGTLRTAAERLPAIAQMGFDVVYLPPVHPIGTAYRKGPNSPEFPGGRPQDIGRHDPGSPWAIGSAEGGHDAIHPDLGTFDDLDAFVKRANDLGLDAALHLALQAAPDPPWVSEHPEWFTTRADGSIAYAENPPKKYQDIYPLNFDNDPKGIYTEVLRVVLKWVEHGVTLFRVDNPHTKPVQFWEWLIAEVNREHPEVLFLAEAFTRPAMMHTLAKVGYHQSYTYFAWRNTKAEITEYLTELSGPAADYMRPSFWPTTHDILTPYMQFGGRAAFRLRAVLAATLVPTYGIYSGYELVENVARPGVEEQIDNEKYEFKPRDWAAAEASGTSLAPLLTRLNQIRRLHPSLQRLRNITFHATDNDQVLY